MSSHNKIWFVQVQREIEAPAVFHMHQAEQPTDDEIRSEFERQGYSDDWNYIGRLECYEVSPAPQGDL